MVSERVPENVRNGVIRVSAKADPKNLAGLMEAILQEKNKVVLQTIGASSLNQATKAVAIARGLVAPNGLDLVSVPAFVDLEIEGEKRTGIRLVVQSRSDD